MINTEINGWMSIPELEWLNTTAKQMQSIIEIGSYRGRSTYTLCSACPGMIFAIDNFIGESTVLETSDIYKDFYENVGHFKNLVIFRTDSFSAAQFFKPKSIDMIFIDGDHSRAGVLTDVKVWMPICKKLICGHDLRPESEVESALRMLGIDFKIATDSIWTYEII